MSPGIRVAPAPSMTRADPRGRPPPPCTATMRWPSTSTSPGNGDVPVPSRIIVFAMRVLPMMREALALLLGRAGRHRLRQGRLLLETCHLQDLRALLCLCFLPAALAEFCEVLLARGLDLLEYGEHPGADCHECRVLSWPTP